MSKSASVLVAALLALVAAACEPSVNPQPTIIFPTEVPIDVPGTPTPRLTGACSLLTRADIEELLGITASQASATPLSCGYAHDDGTVALTLLGAAVWDSFQESFSSQGTATPVGGLGERALYFAGSLGGLLMVENGAEIYMLSGVGDQDAAVELGRRILQRNQPGQDG